MYLPDTNIFIRAAQGKEPERSFISKTIGNNLLSVSVVVVAEFLARANKKEEVAFEKLISQLGVLIIDGKIARAAAEYRREFLAKTKRIIIVDCFLAAQAKIHNITLVTNNKSDFPMKDIKILDPTLAPYTRSSTHKELKDWKEEDKL